MDMREEVRVTWGAGIAGYVAESGQPVNIPDAYQVKLLMEEKNTKTYIRPTQKRHSTCHCDEIHFFSLSEKSFLLF